MTKRRKQVLDYLIQYKRRHGYAPSLGEICRRFRLASVSTASFHIRKLQELGYVKRAKNQPRSVDVFESTPMVDIPLLGTIAAGQPLEVFENKETVAVPRAKLPVSGKCFALKVKGDSMAEENIESGDVVLLKQQDTAESGQKVVALVDGAEATLKTFYKEKGWVRLQPANRKMEPLIIGKNRSLVIQGVLLDVIKHPDQQPVLLENPPTMGRGEGMLKKNVTAFLNKVYSGDVFELLRQLPDCSVDVVFGDPDYNVGVKYGDKKYTKNFQEYIDWYVELTKEALRVLKQDGNLFMINYPKQNAHLRVRCLDNIYPEVSEYVWVYNTNVGHTPRRFTTAHRSVLHVRKSAHNRFYKEAVALPYQNPNDRRILQNLANGSKGRMPYSWFYFDLVKNVSREKTYHACQIPQKLTEMLIRSSTREGDIVLVLFGGSGAELEVCKKMGRNFISAEIDPKYCALINDRLENGYIKEEYKLKLGQKARVSFNKRE